MKLIQIIQLVFSLIGVIWVIIQIKNHFVKQQKSKIGVSYSVYPVMTKRTYKQNFELNQYIDKREIKIQKSYLNISNQTIQKEEEPEELFVEELEFKNIGKKIINGTDFFDNDQLGFKNSTDILSISVLDETPSYINTNIEVMNERVNIKFDKIKPNDSIFLSVLRIHNSYFHRYDYFLGQTEDIDTFYPLDLGTSSSCSPNFGYKELLYLKSSWKYFRQSLLWNLLSNLLYIFIFFVIVKVIACYVK